MVKGKCLSLGKCEMTLLCCFCSSVSLVGGWRGRAQLQARFLLSICISPCSSTSDAKSRILAGAHSAFKYVQSRNSEDSVALEATHWHWKEDLVCLVLGWTILRGVCFSHGGVIASQVLMTEFNSCRCPFSLPSPSLLHPVAPPSK